MIIIVNSRSQGEITASYFILMMFSLTNSQNIMDCITKLALTAAGLLSAVAAITIPLQQNDQVQGLLAAFIDKDAFSSFNKDTRYRIKYRDRVDIFSHILEVANGGVTTKTKIMYMANISHEQLKEFMMLLMESDLLCYESDTHTFKTTEKGLRFLDAYNKMHVMIKT